ncbi:MAG: hypothetical protein ACO3GP_08420 [Candidatus Limnocylindrus sp.]
MNLRIELRVAATVYVGDDVDPAGAKPSVERKPNTQLMFTLVHANMLDACTHHASDVISEIGAQVLHDAADAAGHHIASSLKL